MLGSVCPSVCVWLCPSPSVNLCVSISACLCVGVSRFVSLSLDRSLSLSPSVSPSPSHLGLSLSLSVSPGTYVCLLHVKLLHARYKEANIHASVQTYIFYMRACIHTHITHTHTICMHMHVVHMKTQHTSIWCAAVPHSGATLAKYPGMLAEPRQGLQYPSI